MSSGVYDEPVILTEERRNLRVQVEEVFSRERYSGQIINDETNRLLVIQYHYCLFAVLSLEFFAVSDQPFGIEQAVGVALELGGRIREVNHEALVDSPRVRSCRRIADIHPPGGVELFKFARRQERRFTGYIVVKKLV